MKSNIYSLTKLSQPHSITGNGEKGLIIVLNHLDKEMNIQTLEGMVKAIKYDVEADVTIITKDQQPIDINPTIKSSHCSTLILLGISPEEIGYALNAKKHFFYQMEGMHLLLADSLSDMNADKTKKMAFWKNLQERFL